MLPFPNHFHPFDSEDCPLLGKRLEGSAELRKLLGSCSTEIDLHSLEEESSERKILNFSPWKIVNKRVGERIFYITIDSAWFRRNAVDQLVSMSTLTAHAQWSTVMKLAYKKATRCSARSRESFFSKSCSRFGSRRLNIQLVTVDHQANWRINSCRLLCFGIFLLFHLSRVDEVEVNFAQVYYLIDKR